MIQVYFLGAMDMCGSCLWHVQLSCSPFCKHLKRVPTSRLLVYAHLYPLPITSWFYFLPAALQRPSCGSLPPGRRSRWSFGRATSGTSLAPSLVFSLFSSLPFWSTHFQWAPAHNLQHTLPLHSTAPTTLTHSSIALAHILAPITPSLIPHSHFLHLHRTPPKTTINSPPNFQAIHLPLLSLSWHTSVLPFFLPFFTLHHNSLPPRSILTHSFHTPSTLSFPPLSPLLLSEPTWPMDDGLHPAWRTVNLMQYPQNAEHEHYHFLCCLDVLTFGI